MPVTGVQTCALPIWKFGDAVTRAHHAAAHLHAFHAHALHICSARQRWPKGRPACRNHCNGLEELASIHVDLIYKRTERKRSALLITLTELSAIAAAAIIGESKSPRLG